MGITRQALSMWETGKKEIPEQRKEQLADFFGIDKAYFGEITESEKKELLEKAMFRYVENGQETYRYKPKEELNTLWDTSICFLPDEELSLDERYNLSQKRKKELLVEIEDLIQWTDNAGSLESQMTCINRGCNVFGIVAEFMKYMKKQELHIKMPFFYSMLDVLKAMQLSYDMIEKSSLTYKNPNEEWYCGEDGEWIVNLSKEIKNHWDNIYQVCQKQNEKVWADREEMREDTKKGKALMESQGVEKTIQEVEKKYKDFIEKGENTQNMGTVTYLK
jgi:transcriptional regulator with XRE-family HTH domain